MATHFVRSNSEISIRQRVLRVLATLHVFVVAQLPQDAVIQIYISSLETTSVQLAVTNAVNQQLVVDLNSSNNWTYSDDVQLNSTSNISVPCLVAAYSEQDISVEICLRDRMHSAAVLDLPITADATEFYVMSYKPSPASSSNAFNALAFFVVENQTTINIWSTQGEWTLYREVTVDAFQAFQLEFSLLDDTTGYYVNSTKPIAVFSVTRDLTGAQYTDYIAEQMVPVSEWGTHFIMTNVSGQCQDTMFDVRVLAAYPNTVVHYGFDIDNAQLSFESKYSKYNYTYVIESKGLWWDFDFFKGRFFGRPFLVSCSQPCYVMQYSNTLYLQYLPDCQYTDSVISLYPGPFMTTIPPVEHYAGNLSFSTTQLTDLPNETFYYVSIIANIAAVSTLMFDAVPLTVDWTNLDLYTSWSWSNYTTTIIKVDPGFHNLTSSDPDVRFTAIVYGHNAAIDYSSVAFPASYQSRFRSFNEFFLMNEC